MHFTPDRGFDNKAGRPYKALAAANLSLPELDFSWNALLLGSAEETHTHTQAYTGLVCKPSMEASINRMLSLITIAVDPVASLVLRVSACHRLMLAMPACCCLHPLHARSFSPS